MWAQWARFQGRLIWIRKVNFEVLIKTTAIVILEVWRIWCDNLPRRRRRLSNIRRWILDWRVSYLRIQLKILMIIKMRLMLMMGRMMRMKMTAILKIYHWERNKMKGENMMKVKEKVMKLKKKKMRIQDILHKIMRNNKHMGLLITQSVLHKISITIRISTTIRDILILLCIILTRKSWQINREWRRYLEWKKTVFRRVKKTRKNFIYSWKKMMKKMVNLSRVKPARVVTLRRKRSWVSSTVKRETPS